MTPQPNLGRQPGTWRRAAVVAALLAGTSLGGFAVGHAAMTPPVGSQPSSPAAESTGTAVNPVGHNAAPEVLPNFTHLVEQVKPAVVSITNKLQTPENVGNQEGQGPFPQLPFPFNQMIPQQPQMHAVEARGSGFLINANGTIVTNNHVVKDAKSITATLDDGNTYPAKVIGTDPRTDIAGTQDRCRASAPLHPARQLCRCEARPVGRGDGQPVRPGRHRDRRHRLGGQPRHRRRAV